MTDRYTTLAYNTTVAAGQTRQCALTIPSNIINIVKLKMVPSNPAIATKLAIFKNNTYAEAKKVYATAEYTGPLVDPVEDTGLIVVERNQGFVCAYEDENGQFTLWFTIKNAGASSCSYSLTVVVDSVYSIAGEGDVTGVPERLSSRAYASHLKITSGVEAKKNNATVDLAEFRAIFVPVSQLELPYYDLRTVSEGGTFVPDGSTKLQITGIEADRNGAQHIWTSASAGTWYYAWRLRNNFGWSNWTDGNNTPRYVTQSVKTRNDTADAGPPQDWALVIEDGPVSSSVVVTASRPRVNGDIINWYVVQVKDANTGAWTSLFNGPDADNIKWDGATTDVPISLNARGNLLTKSDGLGWGTAARGDLVLLDVRGAGATWDEAHCQWATVSWVKDSNNLYIDGFYRPKAFTDMRAVIIKPPWAWTSGGYLGGYAGKGFWPQVKGDENTFIGDTNTQEFRTTAIIIPPAVTNPEARAWFENDYSRNDDGERHTTGLIGLPTQMVWTKFNNTRWWIPKYDQPGWCTMEFTSTGAMDIRAVTPRPPVTDQYPGHIFGVQGRFRVFPDTNGLIMFRAKWENVYIPQYTNTEYTTEETGIMLAFKTSMGTWYTDMGTGCLWGNYRNNATIRFGGNVLSSSSHRVTSGTWDYIATSPTSLGYLEVARPTPPYTVEIRMGFSTGTGSARKYDFTCTTLEYRLGGVGGYTPISNVATGLWNRLSPESAFVDGLQPFLGVKETFHAPNKMLPDYTARLTEFAVEYGIIRQDRIV